MLPFIRIIELKTTKNVIQTMFLSMYSCPWEHKVLWSRSVDPNYWTNPELNFEFIKYSPIYISWELFRFQVNFYKCKKIIVNNKNRSCVCAYEWKFWIIRSVIIFQKLPIFSVLSMTSPLGIIIWSIYAL